MGVRSMARVCLVALVCFTGALARQGLRSAPLPELGQRMGELLRAADQRVEVDGSSTSRSAIMDMLRADESSLTNPRVAEVVGTANDIAANGGVPTDAKCSRNWSAACPDGWSLQERTQCLAPGSYLGPCKTLETFGNYNVRQKYKFAVTCKSPWPCIDTCVGGHDYDICPRGWHDTGGGFCKSQNALRDIGRCSGEFKFDEMPMQDKQDFAVACGFEWPCKRECEQDLSANCPKGWAESADLCLAPPEYVGDCGNSVSAKNFSPGQKRAFASKCAVEFPCLGEDHIRKEFVGKDASTGATADGPISERIAHWNSGVAASGSALADRFAQRFLLPSGPLDEFGAVHF